MLQYQQVKGWNDRSDELYVFHTFCQNTLQNWVPMRLSQNFNHPETGLLQDTVTFVLVVDMYMRKWFTY
jgi:hypothetical protein